MSREPATLEDHVNRATLLGLGSEGSDQWDLVLGCSQPSLLHLDCRCPHAARWRPRLRFRGAPLSSNWLYRTTFAQKKARLIVPGRLK
jgi:hypothetical protein